MIPSNSPLDGYRTHIEEWLDGGYSYRQIATMLDGIHDVSTSDRSLRRAVRRWGRVEEDPKVKFEDPSFKLTEEEAHIVSDPREWKVPLNGVDELLIERDLDPEEWEVKSLVVNEWDGLTGAKAVELGLNPQLGRTLKQLKVHLVRKKKIILPVPALLNISFGRDEFYAPLPGEPELVVFVGDHHAPFHNEDLHKRFLSFLADQEPERGVFMGDILDLPNVSRHADEPAWRASTQDCVNAAGQVIFDYRAVSQGTQWVKLPGNHEERIRRALIDNLSDWYGLKPAEVEGLPEMLPFYDPVALLRLDELGVEYIRPKGNYKYARYQVSPYLQAKHGDIARKGSGASALATLDGLDHSVVIGHTHRQSLVQKTVQQIDSTGRLLQAGETGCMCRIEEGLGYAPGPDWSNGFMTANIWPDGTFKLDLATYVDGNIYWRDERY